MSKVDFEPEHPHNAIFCFVWSRSLNNSKAAIEHGCYGSDVSPGKFRVSIFSYFYNQKKKNYDVHKHILFALSQGHKHILKYLKMINKEPSNAVTLEEKCDGNSSAKNVLVTSNL